MLLLKSVLNLVRSITRCRQDNLFGTRSYRRERKSPAGRSSLAARQTCRSGCPDPPIIRRAVMAVVTADSGADFVEGPITGTSLRKSAGWDIRLVSNVNRPAAEQLPHLRLIARTGPPRLFRTVPTRRRAGIRPLCRILSNSIGPVSVVQLTVCVSTGEVLDRKSESPL